MKKGKMIMIFALIFVCTVLFAGCKPAKQMGEKSSSLYEDALVIDDATSIDISTEPKELNSSSPVEIGSLPEQNEKFLRTPFDESNKGDIRLGMSESAFQSILQKNGIESRNDYDTYSAGDYCYAFTDGQLDEITNDYMTSERTETCETSRGLKLGDSLQKMIRLYGKDYVFKAEDTGYYRYYFEGYILEIRLSTRVESWSYFFSPDARDQKKEDARVASEMAGRTAN